MDWYRLRHTVGMYLTLRPMKRALYIKKHGIFQNMGKNCMVMFRKIPLYSRLISFGNNVWVASNVTFIPHDVIHYMLNYTRKDLKLPEYLGCIDIKDNVFIGSNATILPNVSVGPNAIIAAGALVNKSVGEGVYAGVPAKYICSIDEFIEKRQTLPAIKIDKNGKCGLSEETIEACWERFRRMDSEAVASKA